MNKLGYYLPLAVLAVLATYFLFSLDRNPHVLPSALINTPVGAFDLPAIEGKTRGFSSDDLKGQISLVNIFGSWCVACKREHPFLMKLAKKKILPIHGIDWREPDSMSGPIWLSQHGNPYTLVGNDPKSLGAIAFGVTGAPETFLVDKNGVIRFKHAGPLTENIWNRNFSPIIAELSKK